MSGINGEVRRNDDGSPKVNRGRSSSQRNKKQRGILRGLDMGKIITISDDEGDDPHKLHSSTHHHTTRTRVHGRSDALHDMKYHPMDEVTRPKRAAKRRHRSDGVEFDSDDDEELDLPSDSGPEMKTPRLTQRRRHSDGIRRSARAAAHKYGNYNSQHHPQDEELAVAGAIRRRKYHFVEYDSDYNEKVFPNAETNSRETADPADSDGNSGPATPGDLPPCPPSIARSDLQLEEKPPKWYYAEGWGVYNTRSGERYFAHYEDSLYSYPIGSAPDESRHSSIENSRIDRELAQLAEIAEGLCEDLTPHIEEVLHKEACCPAQAPCKHPSVTPTHSERVPNEPSPEFQPASLSFESSSDPVSGEPEAREHNQIRSWQSKRAHSKRGAGFHGFHIYEDAKDVQHIRSSQVQNPTLLADDFPKENVESGSSQEQLLLRVHPREDQRQRFAERETVDRLRVEELPTDTHSSAQVGSEPQEAAQFFHIPVESANISPAKVLEVPNVGLEVRRPSLNASRPLRSSVGGDHTQHDPASAPLTGQNELDTTSEHTSFQTVLMSFSTAGPPPSSHTTAPAGSTISTPSSPPEADPPATSPPPSTASTNSRFPSNLPSSSDHLEPQPIVDEAQAEEAGEHTCIFGLGDDALRGAADNEGEHFA